MHSKSPSLLHRQGLQLQASARGGGVEVGWGVPKQEAYKTPTPSNMQNGKGWWWSKIKEWGHRKGISVVDSRLTLKHRVLAMCGGITEFGSVNLHLLIIPELVLPCTFLRVGGVFFF